MQQRKRKARDAIVGLLVPLGAFAYQQAILGRHIVAGITTLVMLFMVLVYRYWDAQLIEAASEVADADNDGNVADDLKPVLRRAGRFVRNRLPSRNQ